MYVRTYERFFFFVFLMNRSVSTNFQTCILVFGNRFSTVRTYVSMSIFLFSSKNYEYLSVPHPFRYRTVRQQKNYSVMFLLFSNKKLPYRYIRTYGTSVPCYYFLQKIRNTVPYGTYRYLSVKNQKIIRDRKVITGTVPVLYRTVP